MLLKSKGDFGDGRRRPLDIGLGRLSRRVGLLAIRAATTAPWGAVGSLAKENLQFFRGLGGGQRVANSLCDGRLIPSVREHSDAEAAYALGYWLSPTSFLEKPVAHFVYTVVLTADARGIRRRIRRRGAFCGDV